MNQASLKSGILLVDKDPGCTSHDVVARVRRILGTRDVGHAGTLDPLASGLLILLIGQGTKLSDYLMDGQKVYEAGYDLGKTTDTLDVTGEFLTECSVDAITASETKKQILALQGDLEFEIPMYSAKKMAGKKLYEMARAGETPEVRPKKVMSFKVQDFEITSQATGKARIECSKGSFVRTWVDELGKALGVGAYMTSLRRTQSGGFHVDQAVTLAQLEALGADSWQQVVPLHRSLPQFRSLKVNYVEAGFVLSGRISYDLKQRLLPMMDPVSSPVLQICEFDSQNLLALVGFSKDKGVFLRRVFPREDSCSLT